MVNTLAAMIAAIVPSLRQLFWVAITLMVSLVGCTNANDQSTEMSRRTIDALVKKEIPVGTSRDDVIAFLDKQKIEHSGHSPALSPDDIYAIYRNTAGGTLVVKSSIQLVFHFESSKLQLYESREKFTGP